MHEYAASLLRCPECRSSGLQLSGSAEGGIIAEGFLKCPSCGSLWPVEKEITHFISKNSVERAYPEMEKQARTAARLYDRLMDAFAEILGSTQDRLRADYMYLLEPPPGATILDVGAGTGAEFDYLLCSAQGRGADSWRLFGVDISVEMLWQCRRKLARRQHSADLFVSYAENLPFQENTFEVVFHTGSINEFRDQSAAVEEMMRVAKPGARIVIADEWMNKENAQEPAGKRLLKAFPSLSSESLVPIDKIPANAEDVNFEKIWNGYGYCIHFRKPAR